MMSALETELSDGLAPIMGDRVRLQQVILNLVMNAIEAMSGNTNESRVLRVQSQGRRARHSADRD